MPKYNIDYSNCVIYKFVCKNPAITYEYYGHTTNKIKRKQQHKRGCNNIKDYHYNLLLYKTIRENGGWENWDMIIVEEYPCKNVNEAKLRERFWIESKKSELNINIPLRTTKEYKDQNREQIREKGRNYYYKKINNYIQYREEHKEERKKYQDQYREEHKDQLKERKKQYREEHKDQLKERKKQYYEKNKEKILQKEKQRIICECGCEINKGELSRHKKSKKHIHIMNQLENEINKLKSNN